jgi:predicted Ser/Thr protein kinase
MSGGPGPGDGAGPAEPKRFGAYRVEETIGAGGMGVVYRAFDEALERPVALKTLLPALAADPEFVARFKREAQSAAALNHPNITQIYAIGQEGPIPFFAMEMIHGKSLDALVRERGRLEPLEAARYVLQAAQGLRHAAQRQLIHRDIKPSNLMLTEDGTIKITDFGLAKAARSQTQLTATGEVLGSPGYISPEQAQGAAIDVRSDIYSLGATFYQLVTGRLPFEAPTPVAMILKHMSEPLRSPRALNPAVPYPIASIIQRMMAKRPGERFQDYDALARDLERAVATVGSGDAAATAAFAAVDPAPPGRGAAAGRTGRLPPPRSSPAGAAAEEPARSISWLPTALFILLGAMTVFGVVRHRLTARADRGREEAEDASGEPAMASPVPRSASPIEAQGTFTGRPGPWRERAGGAAVPDIAERFRERLRQKSRPNLLFVTNDHEILADGRLKVIGRVRNAGGSAATQARVRIFVLLDSGAIAARAEVPLQPSTVPPDGEASFELPLDYSGPVGTIKAELTWLE